MSRDGQVSFSGFTELSKLGLHILGHTPFITETAAWLGYCSVNQMVPVPSLGLGGVDSLRTVGGVATN